MWKLSVSFLFIFILIAKVNAQQKSFDQEVQLKSCNININANPFVATTIMELEFYNPQDKEVEGFQSFELDKGQVVTDFQLELNGKYREGSIEERWKAIRAYSAIVGKRIDPAILQMDHQDHYSLRIYPIAAHSSRKVLITIKQLMKVEKKEVSYYLPLNFRSATEAFSLMITMNNMDQDPIVGKGLLEKLSFKTDSVSASLNYDATAITLNEPISFSIPLKANGVSKCISKNNNEAKFLLRLLPAVEEHHDIVVNAITVFWDVSLSAHERKINKELDFLENYIKQNNISKVIIVLFNQQIKGTINFIPAETKFSAIRAKLEDYSYRGATLLGNLDLLNDRSDAIFLFSDGKNSLGNAVPKTGIVPVNCIISSPLSDKITLEKIVGTTGGKLIDLSVDKVNAAVTKLTNGDNYLLRYKTMSQGITVDEDFPIKLGNAIFLSGTVHHSDVLVLDYGNNRTIVKTENLLLSDKYECDSTVYNDVKMLYSYDSMLNRPYNYYRWSDLVAFGLQKRIVTTQTSFIVLERIEDYINYKIAPPKELEEKCAQMNYVYKSEYKIRQMKTFTEREMLQNVVSNYNDRIKWWDKNEPLINLQDPRPTDPKEFNETSAKQNTSLQQNISNTTAFSMPSESNKLTEVVVTGAFNIRRAARSTASCVQIVTTEQLNVVPQTSINNALAGKVAGIQVRSQSSAKLGAETFVRLRGENALGLGKGPIYVVNGTIISDANDINIFDIEDVTVLQGPSAAALFGPDGANGAIVVTYKKGKRNYSGYSYWSTSEKLKDAEEMDYIQDIKDPSVMDLWETYQQLQKENKAQPGFYFDMANYFYSIKKYAEALDIMYDGIECCNNSVQGLRAAAYILESWKRFDVALYIYKKLVTDHPADLAIKRDMALAYYQKGNYQKAVDIYYAIITDKENNESNEKLKDQALTEMNAVIALHKDSLDISRINHNLIKALPLDLRIVVESNKNPVYNFEVSEPGGTTYNYSNLETSVGGHFTRGYVNDEYNKNWYGWYNLYNEYSIKNAQKGTYKLKIIADEYNSSSRIGNIPSFVRIIVFKNFHRDGQKMEVHNVVIDNQYGKVEIGQVKW